jgi:hypothetical protein
MKTLLCTVLLFVSFNAFGQRITYRDLVTLLYGSLSQSEEYLTNKGLQFDRIYPTPSDSNAVNVEFSKFPETSKFNIRVSKSAYKNIYYTVSFTSYLQSDYIAMKASLKKLGFRETKSQIFKASLVTDYKKGMIIFTIFLAKNEILNLPEYTMIIRDAYLSEKAFESEKDSVSVQN